MALCARVTWLFASIAFMAAGYAQDSAKPALFKTEEIEQLVAPIALYPDALVAQVLMASTYPLEVVEAARWSKANASLKGEALKDALQKQTWDPSVKSLAAFPQTLAMMNDKLDWTQKLGDAFLGQQKDVMAAVQRLRGRAYAAGNLKSGKEQTVTVQPQDGTTIIIVEPAQPETVYVPVYNTAYVYGPWPYPAYPPYYWPPPAGYPVGGVWFGFTVGIIIGGAWGGCNWGGGNVFVHVEHYNNFNRTNIKNGDWQHRPEHRKGVEYRDQASREKFGKAQQPGVASREAYRGREDGRGDIGRGGGDPFKASPADVRDAGREAGGTRQRSADAGAFDGVGRGADVRNYSDRGAASRAAASRPSAPMRPSGGGFSGGGRAGGGGRR